MATNPITEVWRWNPPALGTVSGVQQPGEVLSDWSSWVRGVSNSVLQSMIGDAAYLVNSTTTYTWQIKGKPVAPREFWTSSGLNLLGFSTVPSNAPNFAQFLGAASTNDLQFTDADTFIYRYNGGDLTNNPIQVLSSGRNITIVQRGQAFWMQSERVFNDYFGPFRLQLANGRGPEFGEETGTYRFRVGNQSRSNVVVTMRLVASETPPVGQDPIAAIPPLLLRGNLSMSNFTYAATDLSTGTNIAWALAPLGQQGSEVEVVLGLNRTAMPSTPGSLVAGVLRFTDSFGYTMVDVPVSAVSASSAGLWVGAASVSQVDTLIKSFETGPGGQLVTDTNGAYIVTGATTNLAGVPASFPLRLIVHSGSNGATRLLQRVFVGLDGASNQVVSTKESGLGAAYLSTARRISASHLPWSSANAPWLFAGGALTQGAALTTSVATAVGDQASNPFLHTYHPDHDNRTADFAAQAPDGMESYRIERTISLNVSPLGSDFASLVNAGEVLEGTYAETIRLRGLQRGPGTNDTRTFRTRGVFLLNRVSGVGVLTTPP